MSDRSWVFLDLETMDVMETTAIISIGMIVVDFQQEYTFEELLKKGFHCKFDYKKQIQEQNRTYSKGTVDFWKKQDGFAKEILKIDKSSTDIDNIPNIIDRYTKNNSMGIEVDSKSFWVSRGQFDYNILRNLYVNRFGANPFDGLPWNHWNLRNMHDAIHFLIGNENGQLNLPDDMLPGFVKHNALHDACADVIRMQESFRIAGLI